MTRMLLVVENTAHVDATFELSDTLLDQIFNSVHFAVDDQVLFGLNHFISDQVWRHVWWSPKHGAWS